MSDGFCDVSRKPLITASADSNIYPCKIDLPNLIALDIGVDMHGLLA
jgi:hypothetical protein